jgi:hypothetical protein
VFGRRHANLKYWQVSILEAEMSRKVGLLLAGLYFLAAVAFGVFHVAADPFLSGPNAAAVSKAAGGARANSASPSAKFQCIAVVSLRRPPHRLRQMNLHISLQTERRRRLCTSELANLDGHAEIYL